jgi:hypothetical protein
MTCAPRLAGREGHPDEWSFTINGAVEEPVSWPLEELVALPPGGSPPSPTYGSPPEDGRAAPPGPPEIAVMQ